MNAPRHTPRFSLRVAAWTAASAVLLLAASRVGAASPPEAAGPPNDVRVSKSDELAVSAPQDMPHSESIAIVVSNGDQPANASVAVSLVGSVACAPQLIPVVADGDTTPDVITGPIVVGSLQSTRLDFIELHLRANEVRNTVRQYAVTCRAGGPYAAQIIVNASSEYPDPDTSNNQDQNHPTITVCCPDLDADGVPNGADTCPALAHSNQADLDGDGFGDVCDADDDGDTVPDLLESQCASDSAHGGRVPERVDGMFAGVDDDGDTQVDEPLPPSAAAYDCDRDGYTGQREAQIFGGAGRDQDPCGQDGWPSDLAGNGSDPSALTIADMGSFLAPVRRIGTSPGDPAFDVRWDLIPASTSGAQINSLDLAALIFGTSGYPPMLAGQRAFGKVCPWAP
jgi:hypothetical protein